MTVIISNYKKPTCYIAQKTVLVQEDKIPIPKIENFQLVLHWNEGVDVFIPEMGYYYFMKIENVSDCSNIYPSQQPFSFNTIEEAKKILKQSQKVGSELDKGDSISFLNSKWIKEDMFFTIEKIERKVRLEWVWIKPILL